MTIEKNMNKESIANYFRGLQDRICEALEGTDSKGKFVEDLWERPGGGGGRSRVMQNGNIIEKGGVGFSAVFGESSPAMLRQLHLTEKADFFATGVSIVMHPHNPMVPIIHMNVRYFELSNGLAWFGGGIDLTPHYVDAADARYFHQQLKNVCDSFDESYYPKFKAWADDYFFITHRKETRGIGGIFFDNLKPAGAETFAFVKAVGESFAPTYTHLMKKNANLPSSEADKQWQYLRRGRYAEFNLVIDRGTKFGLETDGRTESILMSLPPLAAWAYNVQPQADSEAFKTLQVLKKGIDWLA
jgi:coproporphyrinogen III oxidase